MVTVQPATPPRCPSCRSHRRQTLLFSATMPRRVERLAADALSSPVRVTVGEVGGANEDIRQVFWIGQRGALHACACLCKHGCACRQQQSHALTFLAAGPTLPSRCPSLSLPPLPAQVVEVVHDLGSKQKWLLDRLQGFVDDGDVLVFANQKARVDELTAALQAAGARCAAGRRQLALWGPLLSNTCHAPA